MRRTQFSLSLLVVAVAAAVVVSRLGRALGPMGIVLAIVLVVVVLVLVRDMIMAARASAPGPDRRRAPPKNVTPHEPALQPGSVVVLEPANASEQLAAKLQALDGLRADGLVSEDEYEAKRAQLIADF